MTSLGITCDASSQMFVMFLLFCLFIYLFVLILQVARTMQKDDRSGDDNQKDSVSDHHFPLSPLCPLIFILCATDVFVCCMVCACCCANVSGNVNYCWCCTLGQVVLEKEISISVSLLNQVILRK